MSSLSLHRGLNKHHQLNLSGDYSHQSENYSAMYPIEFDKAFEGIGFSPSDDMFFGYPLKLDNSGDENEPELEARDFDTFSSRLSLLGHQMEHAIHLSDSDASPDEEDAITKVAIASLPPPSLHCFLSPGPFSPTDLKDLNSGKIYSPLLESATRQDKSSTISTPKKLTFLKNLESVPTEADIFSIRGRITAIRTALASAPTIDPEALLATLAAFATEFEDISTRANYWGWAPKYFSFIYKILQGYHGTITEPAVLNYCSAVLSYLACLMTKFDYCREPSIQRYFVKKALPRLVEITGKHNTKFDTPSLAMMYICFHLNIDEAVVKFLIDIRTKTPDLFTNNNYKILRYRRAFWLGSVCNRLLIQNDLNNSPLNRELLFQCVSEAQTCYSCEREEVIKSAYNKFFHFNNKQCKYPDGETEYRNFGDGLLDIPNMIQKQMCAILKNDEGKIGGKLISRLKKLIKN